MSLNSKETDLETNSISTEILPEIGTVLPGFNLLLPPNQQYIRIEDRILFLKNYSDIRLLWVDMSEKLNILTDPDGTIRLISN
ncbi:hypothetical protein ACFL21_00255 [Patescibacteria group bacterium]